MNTRKTKILQRFEEMGLEKENKRPRTPEKQETEEKIERHFVQGLPGQQSSIYIPESDEQPTQPDIVFGNFTEHEPKTPERPPPLDIDVKEASKALLNILHSPAWCDPVRPLDILGGQYPDPESIDFQITKSKRVDSNMQVFFVGIRHGHGARAWNFTVQSPPCNVRFTQSKYNNEHPECRVLLSPNVPDGSFVAYPSEYLAFVDHIETAARRLKREMEEMGADTTHWKLPMKFADNICQGLYAKVKMNHVREILKTNTNNLVCTLKLTCVYFSRENSGLSFEVVNAFVKS